MTLRAIRKKIKRTIGPMLPKAVKVSLRKIIGEKKKSVNTPIPEEELKIFDLMKDGVSVVFDVGAREDLSFYKIKPSCSYYLFEPDERAISSLKQQISILKNHDIRLNAFGLSDENRNDCVYYENCQSFISNPYFEGIDTGKRYSIKRMDDYVHENKITKIDFLKIDAEGFDYKIILGGLDTIKTKVSYIQFEYWEGVKKFVDILDGTFNLYLMIEPVLLEAIVDEARGSMTKNQKKKNYKQSIIALDEDVIDLIDHILIPRGYGGNILGIKKELEGAERKLIFPVK